MATKKKPTPPPSGATAELCEKLLKALDIELDPEDPERAISSTDDIVERSREYSQLCEEHDLDPFTTSWDDATAAIIERSEDMTKLRAERERLLDLLGITEHELECMSPSVDRITFLTDRLAAVAPERLK